MDRHHRAPRHERRCPRPRTRPRPDPGRAPRGDRPSGRMPRSARSSSRTPTEPSSSSIATVGMPIRSRPGVRGRGAGRRSPDRDRGAGSGSPSSIGSRSCPTAGGSSGPTCPWSSRPAGSRPGVGVMTLGWSAPHPLRRVDPGDPPGDGRPRGRRRSTAPSWPRSSPNARTGSSGWPTWTRSPGWPTSGPSTASSSSSWPGPADRAARSRWRSSTSMA